MSGIDKGFLFGILTEGILLIFTRFIGKNYGYYCWNYNGMIPGSKGQKFDASLLAGEFLTLGPANIMVCIGWYKKSKSDKKIFQYIGQHDSIISFDPSQTAFSTVNF